MVRNMDSHCPRDYCLSQNTSIKVQTQGSTTKISKLKESRSKDLKPANGKTPTLPRTNKPGKISYQDKKKKYLKKKQDRKNSILAIQNNAIEGEKKQNSQGNGKSYNYQKKGHFTRNYPEPLKN